MSSDNLHSHADSGPPHDPVTADEARVLAVLLGEASPFERESVEELLSDRPDLRAYRDRTAALLGLLPDAAKPDADEPALRLDDARRDALLEKLRETAAAESVSDTTIQFPSDAASRRGRLIGFFRVALVSSRRYAALLAVLLVVGVGGLSVMVPLSTKVPGSHRAESAAEPAAEIFATGSGGGAEDEKSEALEPKPKFGGFAGGSTSFGVEGLSVKAKVDFESEYIFRGKEHSDENVQTKATGDFDRLEGRVARQGLGHAEPGELRFNIAPSPAPVATPSTPAESAAPAARESADRLVAKNGEGRVTLSGAGTYTGTTTVTPGDLSIAGATGSRTRSGASRGDYEGKSSPDTGALFARVGGDGDEAAGSAPADDGAVAAYGDRQIGGRIVSKSEKASESLQQNGYEVPGKKLDASGFTGGGEGSGSAVGDASGPGIGIGKGGAKNFNGFVGALGASHSVDADDSRRRDKVPAIADMPVAGKLFSDEKGRSEAFKETVALEQDFDKQTGKDQLRAGGKRNWEMPGSTDDKDRLSDVSQSKNYAGEEIGDPLLERFKGQIDRARAEQREPEFVEGLQKAYEMEKTKRHPSGLADTSKGRESKKSVDAPAGDKPILRPAQPAPVAQTEILATANAFSTFSLNVSDVSFRLAAEAVKRGAYPEAGGIRSEEFVNAQRYRDPAPRAGEPVALTQDQARHPFAHNRNLVRLSVKTNAEGRPAQQPLSLVVLLDNSGSMERSDRRATVAAAANTLADNLRAGDRVSVIGFSRNTRMLVDRMDGANTKPLRDLANNPPPTEGGTNMDLALNAAYSQLARQTPAGVPGRVVLLTDGAANLGDADPARLAGLVERNRLRGQALDAYGVGFDGYDDGMLERLSRKGDGRYAFLNNADDAGAELGKKLAGALRPFANDVKVQVEFNAARVNSWRLLGYDNHRLRKQDFRDNTVDAAELAAAEAGTALYSYEPKPDGVGDVGVVRVRYRVPGTQDYREREWPIPYETPPAFADAPEGVRLAGCAAFVAETLGNNPNAAGTDRAELRKQVSRLASQRSGDRPLNDLRVLADKLANP